MGMFFLAVPILTVLLFVFLKDKRKLHIINAASSFILLIMAWTLTQDVISGIKIERGILSEIFYIDSLSIIVLDLVLIVGALVSLYSIFYLEEELKHGKISSKNMKIYYILMYTFIFTMMISVTVKNIGIMWIAIEATTLASAFLVGFYNDKQALEATWKYVIICSVGIAIALLGIIFLNISSVHAISIKGLHALDWKILFENAGNLNSNMLRFAFIFILVGFGTKAGLAPMHTWLPDAHSQAPSPISALLSGVLLNTSMYAIIRVVSIVNKNFNSSVFTGRILMFFGIFSIAIAALFILTQKDYKRLLAYSSIEHMEIITFALGVFTPLSIFGVLFHMINHSFTKSMLFLSSGSILQKFGTRDIKRVKNLLKVLPITGTVFFIGLFAIAGTPPFSVFSSEFNIMISVFDKNQFVIGTIFVILLALVFVGIAINLFRMFYQDKQDDEPDLGENNIPGVLAILLLATLVTILGLYMPEGIKDLITDAQRIIVGG